MLLLNIKQAGNRNESETRELPAFCWLMGGCGLTGGAGI